MSCYWHKSFICVVSIFQISGFNQKMHLVVEVFGIKLKSLATGPSKEEFKFLVEDLSEMYENELLDPVTMADELYYSVMQPQFHPNWDRHKRLHSISFSDFQQFCRRFCQYVQFSATMYGNLYKDHGIEITEFFLNNFPCNKRNEIVSIHLF